MDIYVANLNDSLEDDSLMTLFEVFGPVISTNIIKDRETGKSKGFGFVKMHNAIDAQRAIDEMNGRTVAGSQLVVHEAKPKDEDRNFRRKNEDNFKDANYEEEVSLEVLNQEKYSKTISEDGLISINFKN